MRITLTIQRLLIEPKTEVYVYVEKRLLSIVISAVILLSFACTAMAVEKSERYVGDSTVNGSIYQTYYQVDAQTRTGVKKISVSGVLYEKGTIGTWQKVSSCSNSSTTSTCVGAVTLTLSLENLTGWSILQPLAIPMGGVKPLLEVSVDDEDK